MNAVEQVGGIILEAGVAYATANEDAMKQKITAAGISLAEDGEKLIDNAINGANLGPFLSPFKSTIVNAINAEITQLVNSGAKSEVDVLYGLALTAATNEAKKLQAG